MSFIIDLITLFPFAIASIIGNRDGVADDRDDNEANDPQAEDPTQEDMSAKPTAATAAAKLLPSALKSTSATPSSFATPRNFSFVARITIFDPAQAPAIAARVASLAAAG